MFNSDEPPEEVPIKKVKVIEEEAPQEPELELKSIKTIDSIKTPIVTQISESTSKDNKKAAIEDKKNRPRKRNNSQYSSGKLRLLNRLLERSIQHERNAIYQCIKFIANNNFFD